MSQERAHSSILFPKMLFCEQRDFHEFVVTGTDHEFRKTLVKPNKRELFHTLRKRTQLNCNQFTENFKRLVREGV